MTTIQDYRGMLMVHRHRLDDELEIQSDIMDRISVQVVLANSRAEEAKDALAREEARLADDIRDGEEKITVGILDGRVKRHPERMRAFARYQAARAEHESWSGLLNAWKQRGFSIKVLADLYVANYYSTDRSAGRTQAPTRDDDARSAMRRAGHSDRRVNVALESIKDAGVTEPPPRSRRRVVE